MINARLLGKIPVFVALTILSNTIMPAMAQDGAVPAPAFHGPDLAMMDNGTLPCQDFYQYANGTWLKDNQIPAANSSWGIFLINAERTEDILRRIMDDASNKTDAAPGSNEQKIGDFFAAGMDEKKIEQDGIKPLQGELDRINRIKSTEDLPAEIARLQKFGIRAGFRFGPTADPDDSKKVIAEASQGGLGLPERDYYINTDNNSNEVREKYLQHVKKLFVLYGNNRQNAEAIANQEMSLEMKLAEASMTNSDLRQPEKRYHKMTVAQLNTLTPHFDWHKYLAELGFPSITEVNVEQPEFLKALDLEIANRPLNEWKNHLTYRLIDTTAQYLSSKFLDEEFSFWGKFLGGKQQDRPRWKRVIQAANRAIGQPLGHLYVQVAFSVESKARLEDMVRKLKSTLADEITKLDWMGFETKRNALAKLATMKVKIGYPDRWRDYSSLQIDRQSYVWNVLRGEQFELTSQLAKIGKPVDRAAWPRSKNPQSGAASYNDGLNEMIFPAGSVQPPIFDPLADDATNLGSIGAIIGHEITHAFDDNGSKYDASGNLKNWWTKEDKRRFQERIDLIVKQYDTYTVCGDTHLKGKLVAGEAAADLGGAVIAFGALETSLKDQPRLRDANGFTPEQRFFISFAQMFAENTRPEKERLQARTNEHPASNLRVNGTMANMDEFAKAFGCHNDCPMMLPPERRCKLW